MPKKVTADDPSLVNQTLREEYNKLQASYTTLEANFNSLNAKLDADAGVTDTNYASTLDVTVTTADTVEVTQ